MFSQFGGGRNIRPREALETPEDRAAKDARTQQLIAAYKRKMGLNMDPKLKAESEKVRSEIPNLYIIYGFLKHELNRLIDKILALLQWLCSYSTKCIPNLFVGNW